MRHRVALGAVAIAAGGSAFTAANMLPAAAVVHGYDQQTITGVSACLRPSGQRPASS